jgi:hypothetical protein
MRFWLSGPRMLGGLVRPGVSFGPEDLRARKLSQSVTVSKGGPVPATQRELARKAVKQEAIARGMEVPPDAAIDAWLASEVERQRRAGPSIASVVWFIFKGIIAVPIAGFAIFTLWIAAMLLQQMH